LFVHFSPGLHIFCVSPPGRTMLAKVFSISGY
jgi:hypothetical protein